MTEEEAYNLLYAYLVEWGENTGSLHGVSDDGNLEDRTLDAYIGDFEAALPVLKTLRSLPYKSRWAIYQRLRGDSERLFRDVERRNAARAGRAPIHEELDEIEAKIDAMLAQRKGRR